MAFQDELRRCSQVHRVRYGHGDIAALLWCLRVPPHSRPRADSFVPVHSTLQYASTASQLNVGQVLGVAGMFIVGHSLLPSMESTYQY